ncbi:glycosyltransferase family 39 protein [Candidatus Woesearchaeota archaeon]|nr:glycosyltransferase family 39 protein [Candidatus Woesearchaeota archaeon]
MARLLLTDTSYFFWDETIYLMHGRLFAGQAVAYSETFLRPPLLPLAISPFAQLSQGQYELASRLFVAFLNSLVVFPVFFLAKAVFSRKSALIAAAISAFLPVHILNSRWVMTDALGALLAFSSVAAYVLGFQKQNRLLVYCGGVLAGLAVLMKFTNLLLLVLLLPLLLFNVKKHFAAIATSVLLFAAALLPYLVFNAVSFGSPFYAFGRAFQAVAGPSPVSFGFFIWLLKDSFGVLLAFLAAGIAASAFSLLNMQQKRVGSRGFLLFLLYCLSAALTSSYLILGKGVVKPIGMEWEAERFLLLFVLFTIPLISHGIVQFISFIQQQLSPRLSNAVVRACSLAIVIIIAASAIFSLYPQLVRAYAPAISHEGGLRDVTKDIGIYLRSSNISEFGCIGNCPPVAYYSGKKMSIDFSRDGLADANGSVVVFDSHKDSFLGSHSVEKEFCSKSHCAYVMAKI